MPPSFPVNYMYMRRRSKNFEVILKFWRFIWKGWSWGSWSQNRKKLSKNFFKSLDYVPCSFSAIMVSIPVRFLLFCRSRIIFSSSRDFGTNLRWIFSENERRSLQSQISSIGNSNCSSALLIVPPAHRCTSMVFQWVSMGQKLQITR